MNKQTHPNPLPLVEFIARIADEKGPFGWADPPTTEGDTIVFGHSYEHPIVQQFRDACYAHDWIVDFNWPEYVSRNKALVHNADSIPSLDLEQFQKVLTSHVRGDRFTEGHLASLFDSGYLIALLRHLKGLTEKNSQ